MPIQVDPIDKARDLGDECAGCMEPSIVAIRIGQDERLTTVIRLCDRCRSKLRMLLG